jgi:hypothetical protein
MGPAGSRENGPGHSVPAGFAIVLVALAAASGCHTRGPCVGVACGAACPRDASVDASGRCACDAGDVPVLGACVLPHVADAYCGRAARARGAAEGYACAFPVCSSGEVDDVDAGCIDLSSVSRGGAKSCARGALVVEAGRFICVPTDAACPPGSRATASGICVHPPSCPPGSLEAGGACRPVVLRGWRRGATVPVVDLGAWAALVLGTDGGPGAADLCRPLQVHPLEMGLAPGESVEIALRIALRVPDQDVAAAYSQVTATQVASHPLPPSASALAERAVAALLEPLRGLGGEASASTLGVEVRCVVQSL